MMRIDSNLLPGRWLVDSDNYGVIEILKVTLTTEITTSGIDVDATIAYNYHDIGANGLSLRFTDDQGDFDDFEYEMAKGRYSVFSSEKDAVTFIKDCGIDLRRKPRAQ